MSKKLLNNKFFILFLAVVLLLQAIPFTNMPIVHATTTYLDEDMEDLSGWSLSGVVRTSEKAHGGTYSGKAKTVVGAARFMYKTLASGIVGDYHIQFWIWIVSCGTSFTAQITGIYDVGDSAYEFTLRLKQVSNFTREPITTTDIRGGQTDRPVYPISLGSWHKIDVYFVESTGKVRYYIDNEDHGTIDADRTDLDPNRCYIGTVTALEVSFYYIDDYILDNAVDPNTNKNPLYQNAGQSNSVIGVGESNSLFAQGLDSGIGLRRSWLSTNETGVWFNYTGAYDLTKTTLDMLDELVRYSNNDLYFDSTALYFGTYCQTEGRYDTVDPSVIYFENGWGNDSNGHKWRYWMGTTPYPGGNDDYENPSIFVSNDTINWIPPPGITNPIDPYPGVGHNADVELVYISSNSTLYCYYITTQKILRRWSTDGITWSNEQEIMTLSGLISPGIEGENSNLRMWMVNSTATPNKVVIYDSINAGFSWTRTYANMGQKSPNFNDWWHVGIKLFDGTYYMTALTCENNTAGTKSKLFIGSSADGITWVWIDEFKGGSYGYTWDSYVYMGCLVFVEDQYSLSILLYYSGWISHGIDQYWNTGLAKVGRSKNQLQDIAYVVNTYTWSNYTWSNPAIEGKTIGWKIYFEDVLGNINGTTTETFDVYKNVLFIVYTTSTSTTVVTTKTTSKSSIVTSLVSTVTTLGTTSSTITIIGGEINVLIFPILLFSMIIVVMIFIRSRR